MEQLNLWLIPAVAFIPLFIGSIYYNEKVFGAIWLKESGLTKEQSESGSKIRIFALTYLFSLFAAYMLAMITVHQSAIIQLFLMDPIMKDATSETAMMVNSFLEAFGDRHRSFSHGVIHGAEAGALLGLPGIGISALFERKSAKYIFLHVSYFMICFALMGGFLCAYF